MSELQVQNRIFEFLKNQNLVAGLEISVLNRCIDIVFCNEKKELVSIEVKLKDWRKAIEQAKDHQLYADRSYICIPKPKKDLNQDLKNLLRESGVGLMLFSFEEKEENIEPEIKIEEYVKAKKNSFCWDTGRCKIETLLYA